MPSCCSVTACSPVSVTPVVVSILEGLKVSLLRSIRTRPLVPVASGLAGVSEDLEVAALYHAGTRQEVPKAPIFVGIADDIRRRRARVKAPPVRA